ncbi:MAG: adenosine deaminase, partial [Glaciecola sp.]
MITSSVALDQVRHKGPLRSPVRYGCRPTDSWIHVPRDELTDQVLRGLPKVVLHDHLDGGLRPQTVAELAEAIGYDGLPTADPDTLASWFREGADQGDLVRYLEGFDHTCAVVQSPEAMQRIAREFVEDLAADGVVYAEIRFAPERHTLAGMSLDDVIEAATDGFASASLQTGLQIGTLLTIMRSGPNAVAVAEAAVAWREVLGGRSGGIVGIDLAGPEAGFPPGDHLEGFQIAHRASLPVTVHAGEAYGLESIREALHPCGADRIGHGIRIIDDIAQDGTLGPLAAYVRDRGVPLELCPTSNVHTGAVT